MITPIELELKESEGHLPRSELYDMNELPQDPGLFFPRKRKESK